MAGNSDVWEPGTTVEGFLPLSGGRLTGSVIMDEGHTFDDRSIAQDGETLDSLAGAVIRTESDSLVFDFGINDATFATASPNKFASSYSIKAYIASQIAGNGSFQGGYDASANSPDLDTSPSSSIDVGDSYVVTVAGTFFTTAVIIGDTLIAAQDAPTAEAHWTIVQPALTDAQIKTQYENNADTNEFSDAEEAFLAQVDLTITSTSTLEDPRVTFDDTWSTFSTKVRFCNEHLTVPDKFSAMASSVTKPGIRFDATDYLGYERTTDQWLFVIGGVDRTTIDTTALTLLGTQNLVVGGTITGASSGTFTGALSASNLSGTNTGDNAGVTAVTASSPLVSSGGSTPNISIGALTASDITDFDTEVSNNSSVVANSAKTTNSTHTGEVTGASALTLGITAITNRTALTSGLASTDEFLVNDAGALKRMDTSVLTTHMNSNISIAASRVYDFDTEVSNNSSVVANTAKATNVSTNISITRSTTDVTVNSSDGTNGSIGAASTSLAGVLTSATQTIGGAKTFNNTLNAASTANLKSTVNLGTSGVTNSIFITANAGSDEGGELTWEGAGSWANWSQDIYRNTVRFHTGGATKLTLSDAGDLTAENDMFGKTARFISEIPGAVAVTRNNAAFTAAYTAGPTSTIMHGFYASVTRTGGSGSTVGAQLGAVSNGNFGGRVFGYASEAWTNSTGSNDTGLIGGEPACIQQQDTYAGHAYGLWSIFKNRPDGSSTVTLGTNEYNYNSHGLRISSGGAGGAWSESARSSNGEYCGWSKGLSFSDRALDWSKDSSGVAQVATGIDFSEIGGSADRASVATTMACFAFNYNQAPYVADAAHNHQRVRVHWRPTAASGPLFGGTTLQLPLIPWANEVAMPTVGYTWTVGQELSSTYALSLSSTNHALTVGPSGGTNVAIDQNEIQCRSGAGTAATLYLQNKGGHLNVGSGGGTIINLSGAVYKSSGSFRIAHPIVSGKDLVHSFIEGPQADLIYRGVATLSNGHAVVNIDEAAEMTEGTFTALCTDVQAFTTNESGWTEVRGYVVGNQLHLESRTPVNDSVSWLVIGERKDQHMLDTPWTDDTGHVIVEPDTLANDPMLYKPKTETTEEVILNQTQ